MSKKTLAFCQIARSRRRSVSAARGQDMTSSLERLGTRDSKMRSFKVCSEYNGLLLVRLPTIVLLIASLD